jgi:hypothetical protein
LKETLGMAWTIDSALNDKDITVVERDDGFGSYSLRIGELSTVVSVELRARWKVTKRCSTEAMQFTRLCR